MEEKQRKEEIGIVDKIKVVSLFSGVGGLDLGFINQGFEVIWANDFNKAASETYRKNLGNHILHKDITQIHVDDIPECDMIIGGSPCFKEGTLITTEKGLIPIELVQKGDMVLTHKNRFKKVVTPMIRHQEGIYKLKIQGSPETYVTEEHPYYIREMRRVWNNQNKTYVRTFSEPKWKKAKDLTKNDFVGFSENTNSVNIYNLNKEECWLIGRYIADGYIRNEKRKERINSYQYQVVFCIGKTKINEFKSKLHDYHSSIYEERTVYKCKISSKHLVELCIECGKGAENKIIPQFIMDLPNDLLESFFEGYMSGDGCFTKNAFQVTTISRKLVYQLGQVVQKLYNTPYSILFTKRPEKTIIENRVVNQKDTWMVRFSKETRKQNKAVYIDKMLWCPVKELKYIPEFKGMFYNFEVEEDNSYVANNCTVHNCQGFSNANRVTNFLDNPKNLLVREYIRVVKGKKPKIFVLENVPRLLTAGGGQFLNEIKEQLNDYHIEVKVLDAGDYGASQHRKRAILIGSKIGVIKHPEPTYEILNTVRDALKGLHNNIPNQTDAAKSTDQVAQRFKFVQQGQNWSVIPEFEGMNKHSSLYKRLDENKPSITITHAGKSLILHPNEDRILSIRECARIQSFPDDFVFTGGLTDMYQQVGNAVPPLLAEAIAKQIRLHIELNNEKN